MAQGNDRAAELRRRLELMDALESADAEEASNPPAGGSDPGWDVWRALNVIPGTFRALTDYTPIALAARKLLNPESFEEGEKPLSLSQFMKDIRSGASGTYPPTSEVYDVNPVAGFIGDVVRDPTVEIFGGAAALGKAATLPRIAALQKRLIPQVAESLPTFSDALTYTNLWPRVQRFVTTHLGPTALDLVESGRPVSTALRKAGRSVYKTAYKGLDDDIPRSATQATDILINRMGMPIGPHSRIANQMRKYSELIQGQSDRIHDVSNFLSASVSPRDAAREAVGTLATLRQNPINRSAIKPLKKTLRQYMQMNDIPLYTARRFQKEARQAGEAAYGAGGSSAPVQKKIMQSLARGFGDEMAKAIGRVDAPGARKASNILRGNNQAQGALIHAIPIAESLGGLGPQGIPYISPFTSKAYLAYRGLQALPRFLGTSVLSTTGKSLYRLGQIPALDATLLQGGLHAASPWTLLPTEE